MIRRTTSYDGFICFFWIFTIVDWLTLESRARAVWVSPRAFRRRGISSRSGSIVAPESAGGTYSCRNFHLRWILVYTEPPLRERAQRPGNRGARSAREEG